VKAPDTVPLVAAGVYHRSLVDEPVRGFVMDHVVPASSQMVVAVVVAVYVAAEPN